MVRHIRHFPLSNGGPEDIYLAHREARRRHHSTDAELMLYAVHGTLHLLGYEDSQPESAQQMHRTEDAILSELGVGPVYSAETG